MSWWDLLHLPFDLDDLFWLALLIGAVLALLFVGFPVLLALLDVLVVAVLFALGVVARTLLRRPWTIEAAAGEQRVERKAVGWRGSGDEVRALAHDIEHGRVS